MRVPTGLPMVNLSDLKPGLQLIGLLPDETVTLIEATPHGPTALEITYRRANGQPATQILYESDAAPLSVRQPQTTWDFSAPGDAFRLAAEAYRIHLAHLFDPVLAVHTSLIEPLPHQITAVYGEMLSRQPLRFLLADDPGAGKTIMAGLLIKELMVRGDVRRCLICAPGSLTGQWQDELWFKFQLPFDVLTREMVETAVSGNPFHEKEQLIIRLDQVSRSDDLKEKLARSDWDLVIVDEAHKMSASFWGGELKVTKRYRLGELLGGITRHFLLMTATPHNGKEEDFQLFLGLLDPDRFENRSGSRAPTVDVSDIMRRMVKEKLRRFDGRPLFPERRAYTVNYPAVSSRRWPFITTSPTTCARSSTAPSSCRTTGARHRGLCPHRPAAPPGLLAGSHLPISAPPPRAAGKAAGRGGAAAPDAGVAGQRRAAPAAMTRTSGTTLTMPRPKSWKRWKSWSWTRPRPP